MSRSLRNSFLGRVTWLGPQLGPIDAPCVAPLDPNQGLALLHEFCHHLDVKRFGWPDTPHTRGFFCRIDDLYHMALATPADQRRPLVWIKGRNTWRIDWTKLRSQPATSAKAAPQGTTQAP